MCHFTDEETETKGREEIYCKNSQKISRFETLQQSHLAPKRQSNAYIETPQTIKKSGYKVT